MKHFTQKRFCTLFSLCYIMRLVVMMPCCAVWSHVSFLLTHPGWQRHLPANKSGTPGGWERVQEHLRRQRPNKRQTVEDCELGRHHWFPLVRIAYQLIYISCTTHVILTSPPIYGGYAIYIYIYIYIWRPVIYRIYIF